MNLGGGGRGVAAALFSSKGPKNLQNEKISSTWKLLKLTLGGRSQFWVKENDSGHKNYSFKAEPFSGG